MRREAGSRAGDARSSAMECVSCGCDIQRGFAFCPKCGAKQPMACSRCGYPCPSDFAFCPKCGAQVDGLRKVDSQPEPVSAISLSPIFPREVRPPPPAPNPAPGPARNHRQAPEKFETEADRRTVSVLFADLSGFTTVSERLDAAV